MGFYCTNALMFIILFGQTVLSFLISKIKCTFDQVVLVFVKLTPGAQRIRW